MDQNLVTEFVKALQQAYANGGALLVVATVLLFSIRIYRLDPIQRLLPAAAVWDNWPKWLRVTLIFVTAAGSTIFVGISGGMGLSAIIIGAIGAGAAAIGAHKMTKAAGLKIRTGPPITSSTGLVADILTGKIRPPIKPNT